MNKLRNAPRRAPAAARFDADAAALQLVISGDAEARGDRVRLTTRPAPARFRIHRGAVSPEPTGRRAPAGLPCQTHDPDLWFAEAPDDIERAKALCAACPVRLGCLAGAVDRREPTGVWGGQILHNGQVVTHKRARGRPRKDSPPPGQWSPWLDPVWPVLTG